MLILRRKKRRRNAKNALNNKNAETCFNQQMKMLKFPEPKGGGIVIVKYPFEFSAG